MDVEDLARGLVAGVLVDTVDGRGHSLGRTAGVNGEHRGAIDRAIDQADLPTGPVAATRFAWRLRKGTGAETDRLAAIVSRLRAELEAAGGEPDGARGGHDETDA